MDLLLFVLSPGSLVGLERWSELPSAPGQAEVPRKGGRVSLTPFQLLDEQVSRRIGVLRSRGNEIFQIAAKDGTILQDAATKGIGFILPADFFLRPLFLARKERKKSHYARKFRP